MAEAAVEPPSTRFFCHKCTQEINPVLPDFICPRCESGFIEELDQGSLDTPSTRIVYNFSFISDYPDDDSEVATQLMEIWNNTVLSAWTPTSFNDQEDRSGARADDSLPSSSQGRRTRSNFYPTRVSIRRRSSVDRGPTLENLIQQIFASLTGAGAGGNAAFPIFLNLHGNPGDYAWGRGGLDAVITQLLNQLDGSGPPPLPKEKITQIPVVLISQDQVDKILQCTVCMEDFKNGEPVRRLSCQHHFHNDCIIPWLELHGTCPICRKLLNDEEEGMASTSSPSQSDTSYSANNPSASPSVYDFNEECD